MSQRKTWKEFSAIAERQGIRHFPNTSSSLWLLFALKDLARRRCTERKLSRWSMKCFFNRDEKKLFWRATGTASQKKSRENTQRDDRTQEPSSGKCSWATETLQRGSQGKKDPSVQDVTDWEKEEGEVSRGEGKLSLLHAGPQMLGEEQVIPRQISREKPLLRRG